MWDLLMKYLCPRDFRRGEMEEKMEKKNDIVSSLTGSVKTKKHITTKIEYFCNDSEDAERVFEKVTEVLSDNIDDFAKITFDYNAGENKVDVEVIEHV